jgi:hypothetical protein
METDFLPRITTPYLFDKVIRELQQALKDGLPWLENSFGRVERRVTEVNERRLYVPAIYEQDGMYGVMLPDDRLGCYSFFVMHEPQEVLNRMQTEVRIKSPFSLIVWVDMRRVEKKMRMPDERNTEYIKEQVLSVLETASKRKGHISINRIYERAENVFDGFSLDEVKNQFLMSPFAGFRFYGEMIVTNDCNQ